MRKSFFMIMGALILTLFVETGCVDKAGGNADTLTADTLADSLSQDSLAEIIEEEPMPAAADELFDDFFFNFAANRKVQRERTAFPLAVDEYGKETTIEEGAWKIERFFMKQGYFTLIFNRANQIKCVKDTAVNAVTVEKINMKQGKVTRWHFARLRGLWHMDRMAYTTLKQHADAGFLQFYQKFATDTAYQQRRLAESISFTGPDPDDDFSTMTGDIMPEQWLAFAPWLPSGTLYNIVYGDKPYPASNKRFFYIRGIANGLQTDIEFEKRGGNWILTKVVN